MRISSPPTTHSCFYGIDTPERKELLASSHSVEEMAKLIGVDSLAYLSLEALRRIEASMKHGFCDACFSGDYPTRLSDLEGGSAPTQLPLLEIA